MEFGGQWLWSYFPYGFFEFLVFDEREVEIDGMCFGLLLDCMFSQAGLALHHQDLLVIY